MPRFLYSLLLYLLLPLAPLKLLWRGLRQPQYLQYWHERFAIYPRQRLVQKPLIWLHCVSVGETRAAAPLVKELQAHYPHYCILLTHATPTGREAGEQLFGTTVERAYLPYDVPGAVNRFLLHFTPVIGLLMETELWFNLIAACKKKQIPLLLVNARLSQRSASGYAKVAQLTRQGLQNLTAIAAQTAEDAQRLQTLGALNVTVLGNLKFDVRPPTDAWEKGANLRTQWDEKRPVFLAASTREGEEQLILDALEAVHAPGLLTVIVPRHPQRFEEVAALLDKRGIRYVRRSSLLPQFSAQGEREGSDDAPHAVRQGADEEAGIVMPRQETAVVLGDTMGEMFTYYAACDIAFIGGSLLPYGGQNLIEACAVGKPVLIGPHTFNFMEAAASAIAAGAALRVENIEELSASLRRLLTDTALCSIMSQAAIDFSTSATGATQHIANLVSAHLPERSNH